MEEHFRKANWTEESISILVDFVTDPERWAVIRGKFSPSLTVQKKQRVWEEIAERYFKKYIYNTDISDVVSK
uniref:Myb/SANT-like DNA-binding domain-containing protein n=1 Tax=Magallana gigas TaxID=29159 RepID=K1QIK7_MAGGI